VNIKEDIRPISYIKANAAEILAQVNETHRPVYVTQNGEAKAVLLDTESYEKNAKGSWFVKTLGSGRKGYSRRKGLVAGCFFFSSG